MSKFTNGEWFWKEGQTNITRSWNGKDCVIATVDGEKLAWHEDRHCASREAGANARLIAAAPELYEALKMAMDHLDMLYPLGLKDGDALLNAMHNAIQKAEGKP